MVSIVIPVYKISDYIERCIRSVIAQSYCDIECVIVDDATEDDSIEKCERLIAEYNVNLDLNHHERGRIRFKILHHEVNRGLSAVKEYGKKQGLDLISLIDNNVEVLIGQGFIGLTEYIRRNVVND